MVKCFINTLLDSSVCYKQLCSEHQVIGHKRVYHKNSTVLFQPFLTL